MRIIAHRRNTLAELQATPTHFGVEVDLRSAGEEIVIHHDPFSGGEQFTEWLTQYRHQTLILNVKEEGLEPRLISLMKEKGIEDYFFLDQSFPFLVRFAAASGGRSAVRVSEYESIATALALAGRIRWAWIDCFTRFPLTYSEASQLQDGGFKLCLVSPELQGADPVGAIPAIADMLRGRKIRVDAVCTKRPEMWLAEANT